jgi:hypothetical protein
MNNLILHEDGNYYESDTDLDDISGFEEPMCDPCKQEAADLLDKFGVNLDFRGTDDYVKAIDTVFKNIDTLQTDEGERTRILANLMRYIDNKYAPRRWADMGYDMWKNYLEEQAAKRGVSPDDPELREELAERGYTPKGFERDILRRCYEFFMCPEHKGQPVEDWDFRRYKHS